MSPAGWSTSLSRADCGGAGRSGTVHPRDAWSASSRRALLCGGAAVTLAVLPGCGFRPLYGEGGVAPIEAEAPVQVASGIERENDAYNIPDQQFFAADASRDAMERRLVDTLSDSIARRLAVTFRRRADAAASASGAATGG